MNTCIIHADRSKLLCMSPNDVTVWRCMLRDQMAEDEIAAKEEMDGIADELVSSYSGQCCN